MSNKYADLPDIDTAPDVYETEDPLPSSQQANADASDNEAPYTSRMVKSRGDPHGKEELDTSNLISPDDASKRFRKAEKRKDRNRTVYAYPHSPTGSSSALDGDEDGTRTVPLSHRLKALQVELASLEHELSDPSNPMIEKEREELNVDPGELFRGLVDVRGRLNKIVKEKEGRARLVDSLLQDDARRQSVAPAARAAAESEAEPAARKEHTLVDVDRRVEELEKLLGSSSTTLDETSPLPPPLLPLIVKLNSQLALLTQPRHIDSISRRLKILLSDLERASSAQHNRKDMHTQEQLLASVNRIAPALPQIPHILARLRTLSSLHSAASDFQDTLTDLEEEQKKVHGSLQELQDAVGTIERSLEDNRKVVKGNVSGLDSRVEGLLKRVEDLRAEDKMRQSELAATSEE